MQDKFTIAYLAHAVSSDWNNGNAHFTRGLLRALGAAGHQVTVFELEEGWSIDNLRLESAGERSLADFARVYGDLNLETYAQTDGLELWRERLRGCEVAVLHEWNPPELGRVLLQLRDELGFMLLFHDTHHRASSSPEQMERFRLAEFDGVLAFGQALSDLYRERYGLTRVWTLHEAADTSVFKPTFGSGKDVDLVWVGNWGEGERSREVFEYLLQPASHLRAGAQAKIYGVRYPEEGLHALAYAGAAYGGYLPNLDAPAVYAHARMTVHVPRQQYTGAMKGIPTIRVFEALACGIPLISAPWLDSEGLFREGDFTMVSSGTEMLAAMRRVLVDPERASEQAARGLETVLSRHTCAHRAGELTEIIKELRG